MLVSIFRERLRQRRKKLDGSVPESETVSMPSPRPKPRQGPLDDYEQDLLARLEDLQLIGELNLTRAEFDELCRHIRQHQFRGNVFKGLIQYYPATLSQRS